MKLSHLILAVFCQLGSSLIKAEKVEDEFFESLTLHPTPDGKLSVLFEFTTYFSFPTKRSSIGMLSPLSPLPYHLLLTYLQFRSITSQPDESLPNPTSSAK